MLLSPNTDRRRKEKKNRKKKKCHHCHRAREEHACKLYLRLGFSVLSCGLQATQPDISSTGTNDRLALCKPSRKSGVWCCKWVVAQAVRRICFKPLESFEICIFFWPRARHSSAVAPGEGHGARGILSGLTSRRDTTSHLGQSRCFPTNLFWLPTWQKYHSAMGWCKETETRCSAWF